mgnify:CR=1 FL=1|jgi:hypothetical protein
MMNLSSIYHIFKKVYVKSDMNEDLYIAAKQISQHLVYAREIEIYNELIYKDEKNDKISICLDDNRIVKTPGFEIFAFNVDDLDFKIKNNFLYMIIERDHHHFQFLIGSDLP